jgi:Tol biopolymer transport system component/DNA-binding winged helix-turn-helix (wHTH) protein
MRRGETYRFGPYEIRTRTRELYRHGTRLKLRPQPFQVLKLLVESGGDLVTREELRQTLWPGEALIDSEHGLNTSMKELRRALSDSASTPQYIETLPKLGYRMIVPVVAPAVSDGHNEQKPPTGPQTPRASRSWRFMLYSSPGFALAVLLTVWMVIDRHSQPEDSMPMPLTSFPGQQQAASWSPDGRQATFMWTGEKQNQFDIYLLQPGSSQTLRLTTEPGLNLNPVWSPDGRWIAYVHREPQPGCTSLNLISPLGGPIRTVLSGEYAIGRLSWLSDGRAMVLEVIPAPQRPAELWVAWIDTGRHRSLTSPPPGIPGDTDPAVSPDGRTVAFSRKTFWRTAEIYLLDLKPDLSPAGAARRVTDLGYATWPSWTPDNARVVFGADYEGAGLCQVDRSGRNLRPVFGAPRTAGQPAMARRPGGYTSLVFTNTVGETTMWRYSTAAGASDPPVALSPSGRNQGSPRYSNDGKRLAFASNRTGHDEIWVADANGSRPVQLTDVRHLLTETPDWSPSDEQIAFLSQDGAHRQIYVVSASGGPARAITNEDGISSGDGWSHDGTSYYYTSTRSGRQEVWKALWNGGEPQQITTNGGLCGFESTRGVFYYWQGESGKPGSVLRRAADGDHPVPLSPKGVSCRTAPSPRGFYFKSADTNEVYLYDETTERCVRVLRPDRPISRFAVSPDGDWLSISFDGRERRELMIMEHFR